MKAITEIDKDLRLYLREASKMKPEKALFYLREKIVEASNSLEEWMLLYGDATIARTRYPGVIMHNSIDLTIDDMVFKTNNPHKLAEIIKDQIAEFHEPSASPRAVREKFKSYPPLSRDEET